MTGKVELAKRVLEEAVVVAFCCKISTENDTRQDFEAF
jgi:hypothetical protein